MSYAFTNPTKEQRTQGPIYPVNFSRLDDFLKKFLETGDNGKPVKPEVAKFLILLRTIADHQQRIEFLEQRVEVLEEIVDAFFKPMREIRKPKLPLLLLDKNHGELKELAKKHGISVYEVRDRTHLIEDFGVATLPALLWDANITFIGERTCRMAIEALIAKGGS